jgi:hypothetical protein
MRAPASPDTSGAGAAGSCMQAQRWQGAVTATLAAARARAAWPLPACHSGAGGQHLARHPSCDCCCLVCSVVCTCAAVRAARPGWHVAAVGGKGGQGIQCTIKLIVWQSCLLLCMLGQHAAVTDRAQASVVCQVERRCHILDYGDAVHCPACCCCCC